MAPWVYDGTTSDPSPQAIEAAREAFVESLLTREAGDEPYGWDTTLGEIEVYRLRRAIAAAIKASAKAAYRTEP